MATMDLMFWGKVKQNWKLNVSKENWKFNREMRKLIFFYQKLTQLLNFLDSQNRVLKNIKHLSCFFTNALAKKTESPNSS